VTNDQSIPAEKLSRRRFLRLGAVAGGAILGLTSAKSADAATAKVAKQTVSYQPTPKGPARCATCSFFQAPSSCNYVNGPITPTGWCVLYQARA
jgi:anaerobic selenocysteine-containing dehydrogenase